MKPNVVKFFLLLLCFIALSNCGGLTPSSNLNQVSDSGINREDAQNEPLPTQVTPEDYQIYGEVLGEGTFLRGATWNIDRFYERKRIRIGKPKLQPAGTGNKADNLDELYTHWIKSNAIDIIAIQEVLDAKPYATDSSDPDIPDIDGYTVLIGPTIKTWNTPNVEEKCPIYYKTPKVKECSTDSGATMALSSTQVHWAKCKTSSDKQFYFGCAHLSYRDNRNEIRLLGIRMNAWLNPGGAGGSGGSSTQRVEFILGMDGNSYHGDNGLNKPSWDRFKTQTGLSAQPVGSSQGPPVVTKLMKRGSNIGPSSNQVNHILDWLLFQVQNSLQYITNSMMVIPLTPYTKGYETRPSSPATVRRKTKQFLKDYYKKASDHKPVKADFRIF